MINKYLKPFLIVSVLLAFSSTNAISQQGKKQTLRIIIKSSGWQIPDLNTMEVKSRKAWSEGNNTKSSNVYRSVLRPKGGEVVLEDTALYFADEEAGTLSIVTQPIAVSEIVRYDVGGKPFCYVAVGTCVSIIASCK